LLPSTPVHGDDTAIAAEMLPSAEQIQDAAFEGRAGSDEEPDYPLPEDDGDEALKLALCESLRTELEANARRSAYEANKLQNQEVDEWLDAVRDATNVSQEPSVKDEPANTPVHVEGKGKEVFIDISDEE
jgi:hypothetical protein